MNVKKIYLINDNITSFGFAYLKNFSGINKEIIKINFLPGYKYLNKEDNKNSGLSFLKEGKNIEVKIDIPVYCYFYFEGVNPELFGHGEAEIFNRNDNIKYYFEFEKVTGYSKRTGYKKYNHGNRLQVFINQEEPVAFVYF